LRFADIDGADYSMVLDVDRPRTGATNLGFGRSALTIPYNAVHRLLPPSEIAIDRYGVANRDVGHTSAQPVGQV
jgi:hypothetical protein